jgi:hypothetical protein
MLARRFLWIVTILILLVIAGAFAFRLFAPQLMRAAFVPSEPFRPDPAPGPDYRRAELWISRPGLANDPSRWTPEGFAPGAQPRLSVFFVHPTSYLDRSRWIAPIDDEDSQQRARLFVRSQASAFNDIGTVWAPKYRQATVGAFLTAREDAQRALDFAYRDVRTAFDRFLEEAPADRPILLAGHSQGSLHLVRLLADRVAGKPVARRIVAVYALGWPISTTADLPALGLPACSRADQSGCILSWLSFAEPAAPKQILTAYSGSTGLTGRARADTPFVCVNPLTGMSGGSAPAVRNLGTLIPNSDFTDAHMQPAIVPARCDGRGLLLIGENPPDLPRYVLPGNNYHVFDYTLFWANVRADAARRLASFER